MPGVVEKASKKKQSKSAYRRAKQKERREGSVTPSESGDESSRASESPAPEAEIDNASAVKAADLLSSEDLVNQFDLDNPLFEQYKDIFLKFQESTTEEVAKEDEKPEIYYEEDDVQDEDEEAATAKKLSKKARKLQNKVPLYELRGLAKDPKVVEEADQSSTAPWLLISIKATKNVIPVPNHWALKREYLSSKRGIEKPAFALPKFIAETGISEMRDAVLEKQAEMSLKQKQRERVQGKLGKLDIDYQKLYEAFFRRQTKPELTRYGEVYYEGKEYETNLRHLKPGELSDELKDALSMAPGHPPPWLINQQRFGLPPSYPNLRVAGVNAPIPTGASWGYSPGQWGKPPVDDHNRPLWGGDPIGTAILDQPQLQASSLGEPVERSTWGALRAEGESEDEESEEEEEDDEGDEDQEGDEDMSGIQTSVTTASTIPSEIGGTESIAGEFTLRKQRRGIETEEPGAPRSAYQVLPEKNIQASGFFGGEHAYDLDAARKDRLGDSNRKRKAGDVEVSVDVDALTRDDKMDKETLRQHYEAQKKAEATGQWASIDQDDLSEMIANESRKRQKREEQKSKGGRR
ncbi:hypothetical protein BDV96DRAFT_643032 [Lophiotrema nucula]|uniref:PSP proline-rich domain-containing protein n=1 Tax=Lophiotrema nucula TaxID=690887 RepID=A0A6A5ZHB0_9PLEO|nr:hypothetical protein BDV96DRAFT_643032 [Lophiotrema nucula]